MVEQGQDLGHGPEVPSGSVPIPTERGSDRFNWRNAILGMGLIYGPVIISGIFPHPEVMIPALLAAGSAVMVVDKFLPLRS